MANCSQCGKNVGCGCNLVNGLCAQCRKDNREKEVGTTPQTAEVIELSPQVKPDHSIALRNAARSITPVILGAAR